MKVTIKNKATAPQGFWVGGELKFVGVGKQRTFEMSEEEAARAGKFKDIEVTISAADAVEEKPGPTTEDDTFDAEAFIDRTLDDITDDELLALTPQQIEAVRRAEEDREKPRKGLTDRLTSAAEASAAE